MDPFSETLRGKSVVVEFDDLQMMCINKSDLGVHAKTNRCRLFGTSGEALLDFPGPLRPKLKTQT